MQEYELEPDEQCERCGQPATGIMPCKPCKGCHALCEECMDLFMFTYACEDNQCFLIADPFTDEEQIWRESIKIPEKLKIKFSPGKKLREAVIK